MTVLHRVCLIGFGTFERTTFDLFFRMAEQRARRHGPVGQAVVREHGYLLVAPAHHPEIVLVNADVPDAVREAWRWPGRCVSIGAQAFAGAVAHLPRPVHMQTLLKVLDDLIAGSVRRTAASRVRDEAANDPSRPTEPGGLERPPATPVRLLVADDNENTLRSMRRFLRRLGLAADLARSGEEALWRVAEGRYDLVLLDSRMGGISGWVACRLIKTRPYPEGRRAPRVVMMARHEGVWDPLRERLSRCDDRLLKPLGKAQVLAHVQPLIADTSPGAVSARR
jgi:CheY-like chemotaxis protein